MRSQPSAALLSVLSLLWVLSGCRPGLAEPGGGAPGSGGGGGGSLLWTLEPASAPDQAPHALRIRLRADPPIGPERVHFVRGHLGPGHLRQLAAGAPSNALEERFLPATLWREGTDLLVAPHDPLEPGLDYGLALADRGEALELVASKEAPASWLARAWPPSERPAVAPMAIFCGDSDLPPFERATAWAPTGDPAVIQRGALSNGAGRRCVRVVGSEPPPPDGVLLVPPALSVDGATLALDPRPLVMGGSLPPAHTPLSCIAPEVAVGPGCALVLDDRATVRVPEDELLWAATGSDVDTVALTLPGESFNLHPLVPASPNAISVGVVDLAGREELFELVLHTTPPMPHVVLNEMLANCVGAEPACEWIELMNDGAVVASLEGFRIVDVGGEAELPAVDLAPGALALVVGEDYVPDPALDRAPPPDVVLLRVPRLGRGGLANAGELVRLFDREGRVVSAIPAMAADEPGESMARRHPALADVATSFVSSAPTPGEPNGLE